MDEFSSHITEKFYKMKCPASFKSSNIVYLITCRRCGLQYTGKPLHARTNDHLSDIMHQRTDVSPVVEHFNSGAHSVSDMTVMAIKLSTNLDPYPRKVKEGRWIGTLETSFPCGMNLWVDSLWNLTTSSSVQLWVSCPFQLFATLPSPGDYVRSLENIFKNC